MQGDDFTNCLKQMNQFGLLKKYPIGGPQVELEPLWGLGPEARAGYWGIEWYYKSDLTLGKNNKLAHDFVAECTARFNALDRAPRVRLHHARPAAHRDRRVEIARRPQDRARDRRHEVHLGVQRLGYYRKEDHQLMWPDWIAKIRPTERRRSDDLFDVLDLEPAEDIEQSGAEKEPS